MKTDIYIKNVSINTKKETYYYLYFFVILKD